MPAKAELLVWFLIHGWLNTKERLHGLQVLRNNDTTCPICNSNVENLSHLFFSCGFAWDIWRLCCQQWGMSWVLANCPRQNFEVWLGAALTRQRKKLWISCFFAIVWSIFEFRNKVIFENKPICKESFLMELSHRWNYWISAWHVDWGDMATHWCWVLLVACCSIDAESYVF